MNAQDYLKVVDQVIENGEYKDNWQSLCGYGTPEWYRNGKFGIFIHWGIYCVPAFGNEWYPRNMYQEGTAEYEYHLKTYGSFDRFGYKDFIPMFKAEKFDATQWAELFEKTGACFVMPVAEHHDGFQMYKSELSKWNAVEMGPCRDILGELKTEVEKRGMRFAASSHRAEHYWFMDGVKGKDPDFEKPEYIDFYGPAMSAPADFHSNHEICPSKEHLDNWLARTAELIDKYKPKVLFFDWWVKIAAFKPYLKKLAAFYYNRSLEWGEKVAINYKYDAFATDAAVLDVERGNLDDIRPYYWQNDTSVAKNSWGYTEGNDYKTADEIICVLIDCVSKNGGLCLNIGPKADGTIPDEDAQLLIKIGKWLNKNEEGIYGTHAWKVFGEGPTKTSGSYFNESEKLEYTSNDIRFTYKNGQLYAFVLKWPKDGIVTISSLASGSGMHGKILFDGMISDISVLGYESTDVCWINTSEKLVIKAEGVQSTLPVCLKIILD